MEPVYREALKLSEQRDPFVIATVVGTKGSTPQKAGAKLLIRKDGSGVGTLGGGCVEGDIWFAAKEALRRHEGPQYRDYYLNEEIAARDGLVCGGSMYFFIDPIWEPAEMLAISKDIVGAYEGRDPVALATLVKVGSQGGVLGAKLFVNHAGAFEGSLGTGERDRLALEAAQHLMDYGLNHQVEATDGSELFVEAYTSPASLVLVGGGHISKAVAPLAKMLGFRLFVLDDRREFANQERFPEAESIEVADYATGLEQFPITPNSAIVIATRGHNFDDVALEAAARSTAGYVGLVGSRRKVILIYEELLKRGIPLERIRDIHAPIGLDVGARTPEEIAMSIMAEVLQVRFGGTSSPLKLPEKQLMRISEKVFSSKVQAEGVAALQAD